MTDLLPGKPSSLIRVALADLKACENDDAYRVNMAVWHSPDYVDGDACAVCFAGSVMAQTLRTDPTAMRHPIDFSWSDSNALYALNMLRVGYVKAALSTLLQPRIMEDREIVLYEDDSVLFHIEMNDLANDLEKVGI